MSDNGSDSPHEDAAASPAPVLNRFSCISCRRRKIKCDKTTPCNNCSKARFNCVFPPPRRSGKTDADSDRALIARLHRMESIITSLRQAVAQKDTQLAEAQAQVQAQPLRLQPQRPEEDEPQRRPDVEPPGQQGFEPQQRQGLDPLQQRGAGLQGQRQYGPGGPQSIPPSQADLTPPEMPSEAAGATPSKRLGPLSFDLDSLPNVTGDWRSGKLIEEEGRRMYISGTFWVALKAQIDELGDLVQDEADEEEEEEGPLSLVTTASAVPTFPFQTSGNCTQSQHPSPQIRERLWTVYKENIDPVIHLIHLPTVEPKINEWLHKNNDDMTMIPKPLDSLMKAIYFSAVSSLESDECREYFGIEREVLVADYRAAVESAMLRADLLETDELFVLQSFLIYLITLRIHAPRLSWTYCSLAARLLQSMGAHRDGACLSRSIFDSEMFKRLFWHLGLFECGGAEDSGCDPIMKVFAQRSKNLDDKDLHPEMIHEPQESSSWAESTLLILFAEIIQLWRLIYDSHRKNEETSKSLEEMTELEKRTFTDNCVRRIGDHFSKICSPVIPVQWVTAILARSLILEFKLAACKALERYAELTPAECDGFFLEAIECIELSNKLMTDRRGARWTWLFKSLPFWYPLGFVLSALIHKPLRIGQEKAWRAIEQAMIFRWQSPHRRLGHQWRSMLTLLDAAQVARSNHKRKSSRSRAGAASVSEFSTSTVHSLWTSHSPKFGNLRNPDPINIATAVGGDAPRLHVAGKTGGPSQDNALEGEVRQSGDQMDSSNLFSLSFAALDGSFPELNSTEVGDFDLDVYDTGFFRTTLSDRDAFTMDLS